MATAPEYTRERPISFEHAVRILAEIESDETIDPASDYYLSETEDGTEYLTEWGHDQPIARNRTGQTWRSL